MNGPQSLLLLAGVATDANGDGEWMFIGNWPPGYSVINTGLVSGDKTQIWVSNNRGDSVPAGFTAAAGAVQLGNDITADGITVISEIHSWIAIRKTAFAGGGAIVVRCAGIVV